MTTKPKTENQNPLARELETLRDVVRPRLARLMGYYRNPMADLANYLPTRLTSIGVRPYRQYQEIGLPARITGFRTRDGGQPFLAGAVDQYRREVVIENDIAWRMHTIVDFACGQMPVFSSTAKDPATRSRLTAAILRTLDHSGGVALIQHLILEASIHGTSYVVIQPSAETLAQVAGASGPCSSEASPPSPALLLAPSAPIRLSVLPASRVAPVFTEADIASGAELSSCAILKEEPTEPTSAKTNWLDRVGSWVRAAVGAPKKENTIHAQVWEPSRIRTYAGDSLINETASPLGFVPVIGFINQADAAGAPIAGLGVSDVEPLIPLQDELNTRLSDRANRVTLQSFRMYLGKGIEDFTKRPVGPGQMWSTDNPDASITPFGGDSETPSEAAHINEIREALDKVSGVTPVAAGLLRGKVGNLTSAVALHVTLIALLARITRKRGGLELTLAAVFRRVLEILDRAGIEKSAPEDREIEITWPSPIPENMTEKLTEAQMKLTLGVPRSTVLAELGYDPVEINHGIQTGKTAGKTTPGPDPERASRHEGLPNPVDPRDGGLPPASSADVTTR